jgi:drug/metabolite transporter (DMT)-like permease
MNFFWAAVYSAYKVIGHDLPVGAIVTLRFGLAGLCLLFAWPWLLVRLRAAGIWLSRV